MDERVDAMHRDVAEAFADAVEAARDGAAPIPHLDWTVDDLAAHVASALAAQARMLAGGEPVWPTIDSRAGNRALIDTVTDRSLSILARDIRATSARVRELASQVSPDQLFTAWGPCQVTAPKIVGIGLADLLTHGWDLSRATGHPWTIDARAARVALDAMMSTVADFVNADTSAGVDLTFGVSVRGGGAWTVRIIDGCAEVAEGRPTRADCRMSMDPVVGLLVNYGRVPPWRAALTGKATATGRKPWLAFRFTSFFHVP